MVLNRNSEPVRVDDAAISVCNHCECEEKDGCKRFDKSVLACYNYEAVKVSGFNCFIKKEAEN
jgi:hypothetical protein